MTAVIRVDFKLYFLQYLTYYFASNVVSVCCGASLNV